MVFKFLEDVIKLYQIEDKEKHLMTVKELRDILDEYIKRDPPDTWQLNDVEADAAAYRERCKVRANREVVITDDGMQPKHFGVNFATGTIIVSELMPGTYSSKDVLALITDLTNPLK